jgi:hypothetical protein
VPTDEVVWLGGTWRGLAGGGRASGDVVVTLREGNGTAVSSMLRSGCAFSDCACKSLAVKLLPRCRRLRGREIRDCDERDDRIGEDVGVRDGENDPWDSAPMLLTGVSVNIVRIGKAVLDDPEPDVDRDLDMVDDMGTCFALFWREVESLFRQSMKTEPCVGN